MMKLTQTEKVLQKKIDENILDTYAVYVKKGDERAFISRNANEDTFFDVASMGKVLVTAALILKAESEGRLSLDDTLPKYFPNVPDDKKEINLRRLLTHTSGIIRTFITDDVIEKGNSAIAEYILNLPLGYPVGKGHVYSCFGYLLLGFIAEKVWEMPLDAAFNEKIKKPLGISGAGFNLPIDTKNMACTHYRADIGDCACADDIVFRMKGVAGNGASFWTVNGLKTFIKAVMEKSPQLYSAENFERSEKNNIPELDESWGLGWLVTNSRYPQTGKLFPEGSFGHCGNTGTSFFMNREKDMYVILLTNATRFSYIKHNFTGCDYSVTMKMREDVHNAILEDIENS